MGEPIKPPGLPRSAPPELRDFVACRRLEVTLDPARLGWLPRPAMVPESAAPDVTPTVTGPNSMEVSVGWGFVSITLPVSVADGHLQIDSSNIPDLGGLKSGIDNWVKAMNDTLDANGKRLSGLELKDGKIVVTKQPVAGAQRAAATPGLRNTTGMKVGAAVAGLLLVGAAVFVGTRGSDSTSSTDEEPTATAEPDPNTGSTTTGAVLCELTAGDAPASFYSDPELLLPCEEAPADGWATCPNRLPCFPFDPVLIVPAESVGVSHQGSVADALTGRTGPSQATFKIAVVSPMPRDRMFLQVASQCGQDILTGQSPIDPSGVTTVSHPLFQYGPCEVASLLFLDGDEPPKRIPFRQAFEVGPDEPTAGEPAVSGLSVAPAGAFDAAGTLLGVLGDQAIAPECVWLFQPGMRSMGDDVVGACASRYVAFDIGAGDDRLIAHGGGFLNPLGLLEPRADDLLGLTNSVPFGEAPLFPCGPGRLGWTICPDGSTPLIDAGVAAVSLVTPDPLMSAAAGSRFEVAFRNGHIYAAERTAGGWSLTSDGPTNARAVVRGNSLTFVVPHTELPAGDVTYTVTLDGAAGPVAQPEARIVGVVTTPGDDAPGGTTAGGTTAGDVETPQEFFADLSASIASGDLDFALARLHPNVIEAFGEAACTAELTSRVAPGYSITVESVGAIGPWTYTVPDGRTWDHEAAQALSLLVPGSADPVEGHLVFVEANYRWFTICE
ncbi:MAG: hypothetical protein Q7V57_19115 [Actinomycetota bacterium]|nr:hypothetical protein [Actinomycetota bacterium]